MKVLIVDDEPLELEQLEFLISRKYPDWTVLKAEDSPQAQKVTDSEKPDLALLDIHLPGESGLVLAEKLRDKLPEIKIVIVTAFQSFDYARKALQMNAVDYIVKPVIAEEFYAVIKRVRGTATEYSPALEAAQRYLQAHFRDKVSLQVTADTVHVSPAYLSRKFSEEMDMTFKEYLLHLRIDEAKTIFRQNPYITIQEASEAVGFQSQHHFSNSFHKAEGETPSAFKKRMKND